MSVIIYSLVKIIIMIQLFSSWGATTAHSILILSQYNLFDYFTGTFQPQEIRASLPIEFWKTRNFWLKPMITRNYPWELELTDCHKFSFDRISYWTAFSRSNFSYMSLIFEVTMLFLHVRLMLESIVERSDYVRFWSIVTPLMANSLTRNFLTSRR